MKLLIFGCGYLGRRVAQLWCARGGEVFAVTRSADRATQLQPDGATPCVADITRRQTLHDLPAAPLVLFAVGFDRSPGPSIHDVYAGGLQNVLATRTAQLERLIYISTTGVYAGAQGEWVDEQTQPAPSRDGARASLAAEQQLAQSAAAEVGVILRLAGLYGPDRVPYLDRLQSGAPLQVPRKGWLNLIHVDDAAAAVVAALTLAQGALAQEGPGPHIMNIADGQPVIREEYYQEVARRIVAAPPRFAEPDPASRAAARGSASRRIRSDRMRSLLGLRLRYPSYREGLAAILGPPPGGGTSSTEGEPPR